MQTHSNPQAPISKAEFESSATRPRITQPAFCSIPSTLVKCPQWFNWLYDRPRADGKWPKVPCNRLNKRWQRIKHTQPDTWGDFETAAGWSMAYELHEKLGVGFEFTAADPFCLIDIDDCRNNVTGEITPSAMAIVERFNSYTEVSQSETGLKIFIRAVKAGTRCRSGKVKHVEIYDRGRFAAVTGYHLAGTPTEVEARQAELDQFYAEMFPSHTSAADRADDKPSEAATNFSIASRPRRAGPAGRDLSDHDIIDIAERSKTGAEFRRLWAGSATDFGGDLSRADFRLAQILAFYCGPNPERVVAMMKQSGLQRDKWKRYAGYLLPTVEKAIAGCTSFYGDGTWLGDASSAELREMADAALPAGFFDTLFGTPAVGKAPALGDGLLTSPAELIGASTLAGSDVLRGVLDDEALAAIDSERVFRRVSFLRETMQCPDGRWMLLGNYKRFRGRWAKSRCRCLKCVACHDLVKFDHREQFCFAADHDPVTRRVWVPLKKCKCLSPGAAGPCKCGQWRRVTTGWTKAKTRYIATIQCTTPQREAIEKSIQRQGGVHGHVILRTCSTDPDDPISPLDSHESRGASRIPFTFIMSNRPFDGSTEVTPAEVKTAATDAIQAVERELHQVRDISLSRLWKVKPEKGDWKLVGGAHPDLEMADIIKGVDGNGQAADIGMRERGGLSVVIDFAVPQTEEAKPGMGQAEFMLYLFAIFNRQTTIGLGGDPSNVSQEDEIERWSGMSKRMQSLFDTERANVVPQLDLDLFGLV